MAWTGWDCTTRSRPSSPTLQQNNARGSVVSPRVSFSAVVIVLIRIGLRRGLTHSMISTGWSAFVTSDAEFDAKTTPDMDVKVVGQPEAAKLEKGNPVRFTGTLVAYDPDPNFMLHWDKAKVNAEDIPKDKEKKAPTKKRPVTKKPGRG